jgi:hypothetical protein
MHLLTCQRVSSAHHGEPCRNDCDGYLSVHALVHKSSKDDVGIRVYSLVDHFSCGIDLRMYALVCVSGRVI